MQRCGGVTHQGCACANKPQADDRGAAALIANDRPAAPLLLLQRKKEADKLTSPALADSPRLQTAFKNQPPLRMGERGDAAAAAIMRLQLSLHRLGFFVGGDRHATTTRPSGRFAQFQTDSMCARQQPTRGAQDELGALDRAMAAH